MKRIDAHLHLGDYSRFSEVESYQESFPFDRLVLISLPDLEQVNFNTQVLTYKERHPDRTYILGELDYRPSAPPLVEQLIHLHSQGFDGLKLILGKPYFSHKYGIHLRETRFKEVFRAASEEFPSPFPILVHVADPLYFWQSIDASVTAEPAPWSYGPEIAPFEEWILLAEELVDSFPRTIFVFPHLLFLAHDLDRLERILLKRTGVYTDLAPGNYFYRDLSVQKDRALQFFSRCRERILFGSDGFFFPPAYRELPYTDLRGNLDRSCRLIQFLESSLPFSNPFPLTFQEKPLVEGLDLHRLEDGEQILRKIYYENVLSLLGDRPKPLARNPFAHHKQGGSA
ncbi:MAG: hypothetical protein Kow009_03030 [Spirochaetales bacterium]